MTTRILIGGLDGAGKSTIVCSLAEALRHDGVTVQAIEIDPWSDTHDIILGKKSPELRNARHEVAIGEFRERVEMFRCSPFQVVLGDLQGMQQYAFNFLLEGIADRGIIIGRERTDKDSTKEAKGRLQTVPDWLELYRQINTPVDCYVHSLLPGQPQTVRVAETDKVVPAFTERKLVPYNPHIQELKLMVEQWLGPEWQPQLPPL